MDTPMNITLFSALSAFVYGQNRFQQRVGQTVAWLVLLMVLLTAAAVLLRYGFNFSDSRLDEGVLYLHALFFMLGMAYTYQQNHHVRVDVFYSRLSARAQTWINLLGALFLVLPTMVFILWSGWDYVAASWAIKERSIDAKGLAYVYLLKSVILIMAGLLILQTLAFIVQYALQLFKPDALAPAACAQAFNDAPQQIGEGV